MKRTPFFETHRALGGKLVEFGGFELPVQYTGIVAEHRAVRERAGLFDVSHMGEFRAKGPDATRFVQHLVTNDVARGGDRAVTYTPMCLATGGVVDDLLVYRHAENDYLLVVNAANIDADWAHVTEVAGAFDVALENRSDATMQLALQGPKAVAILSRLTAASLSTMKPFTFAETVVAGVPALVSRTGYTGEDGFEVYSEDPAAAALFRKILEAGAPDGILPCGLGCRDTLRFEAKLMLYGHELSRTTDPITAGIGWTVKFDKGDFLGREAILAVKNGGQTAALTGLEMIDPGVPRQGCRLFLPGEAEPCGVVTSGTHSPTFDRPLAMGFVPMARRATGAEIEIEIRDRRRRARVAPLPFYRRKPATAMTA